MQMSMMSVDFLELDPEVAVRHLSQGPGAEL